MIHDTGPWGWGLLALLLLALLTSLVTGGLLLAGWRVPAPLPIAVLALPSMMALVQDAMVADLSGILSVAAPDQKAVLVVQAIAQVLNLRLLGGAMIVPAGLLLAAAAIAGVVRGPRSVALAVVAGGVGLVEVLLAFMGAGASESPMAAGMAMMLMPAALGLAMACVGVRAEKNGPEAAVIACLSLSVLVAAAWGSIHASSQTRIFSAIAMAAPDQKAELLEAGLSQMAFEPWLGTVAVALPAVLVAIAIFIRREDGSRAVGFFAAGLLALPVLIYAFTDPFARQAVQMVGIWAGA